MQIQEVFERNIHRSINGVVKADQLDAQSVWQELDEFVVTKELTRHFDDLIDVLKAAVKSPNSGKNGIWVSGLSRLLNYLNMIRKIKTKISNNVIHIFNKNNTNETLNLSGLTIYCNNKNLNKIYYNDKELNFKKNPEDETNKTSVSVEMITLKDIW